MALWNLFSKKKSAQEMLVSGDLAGALKAFKKQLKAKNNKDPLLMLKIGSIYQQLEQPVRARSYFMAVGEYYGEKGFLNKAVAAYKKALDITPNDKGILEKLASYNNQVPKYMINTDILDRIRQSQTGEQDSQLQEESDPVDAIEMHEATYKFPEEDIPQLDAASKALAQGKPESIGLPQSSEQEETPEFIKEILDRDAEAAQAQGQDSVEMSKEEPSPEGPLALDLSPVEDEHIVEEASEEISPLQFADPDFDPNESLRLDEDFSLHASSDAMPSPVLTEPESAPETVISHPPSSIKTDLEDEEEIDFDEDEDEEEEENDSLAPGLAKRVSDDQKMVFSMQKSSPVKPSGESDVLRSFSSLDDALEDLFSTGQEEDRDLKKEQDQRHFPLFRTMSTKVFVDFVMALENSEYETGQLIVKQGDPGNTMYILAEGEVDVILTKAKQPTIVASLKSGDFFGEVALITGKARTASVVAKSPTTCLVLSRSHLEELSLNHPSVVETIRSVYYARMRENESHGS